MPDSPLDLIRSLFAPPDAGVARSDAPPTNERDVMREGQDKARDIPEKSVTPKTPDHWVRDRPYGPGASGRLGYTDHADPVRVAERMHETTAKRFPDLNTHGRPGPAAPEYNQLYSILKNDDDYDKIVLATAHNTWVVGTTTSQPVTLDVPLPLTALFNQFPGTIQIYPILLVFTFAQSVLTATGEYSMAFIPQGGNFQYPLGEYNAGIGQTFNSVRHIIHAAITDPGQTNLGSFVITSNGVTGTPNIFWRLGFGFAAFIPAPAFRTSEALRTREWIAPFKEPNPQEAPNMPVRVR